MYIDTYLSAEELEALKTFCENRPNVIGPACGRAALGESLSEDGNIVPAQPAAGDPARYYACIRDIEPIAPSTSLQLCDSAEGQAVLGIWA